MESTTLFAIGLGFIAAMELGERLAAGVKGIGRRLGLKSKSSGIRPGQRADVYAFFRLRDLYGPDPAGTNTNRKRNKPRQPPRRQRPELASVPR